MNSNEFARIAIGLLFLCVPQFAMAQGSTASNVPVLSSGQTPAVVPGAEEALTNVLRGSLALGANYNDKVFGKQRSGWDLDYIILPTIALQETRSRVIWGLNYGPGLEISQNLVHRSTLAQHFDGNLTWRTSPHGILTAQQYYFVTTNPFAGFSTTSPGPTISPNQTIFIPGVKQTLLLSHALYSYQSSARTIMGVGGAFEQQKFDDTPHSGPTTALVHSQIASGEAYIADQLNAHNQLGFQYGAQVLRFPQANARTTTHTFLVFDQMNFWGRTTMTLYAGPEYSLISNELVLNLGFLVVTIPVHTNQWSASGGVTYNWTGNHLAAGLSFSRRVSNGGGLIGAVELTSGTAEVVWQLTRGWHLAASLGGADDQLLGVKKGSNELRNYYGRIELRRRLWRNADMSWFYERRNQAGSINGLSIGNRDLAGAKLEYSFLKPLGG